MRECVTDGCEATVYAKDRCQKHYRRWNIDNSTEVCSIDKCETGPHARGMCRTHYSQWQKKNSPPKGPCSIDGCEKSFTVRGWCPMHYARWRKHGDPLKTVKHEPWEGECPVPDCGDPIKVKGYCPKHHQRKRRWGNPAEPSHHVPNPNGMRSKGRTYRSWRAMKTRCTNKNYWAFHRYGGRGINVCERWKHSFDNFLEDMGERPEGMTIDRIDNDGNYEPSNCRWATQKEQVQNRSH